MSRMPVSPILCTMAALLSWDQSCVTAADAARPRTIAITAADDAQATPEQSTLLHALLEFTGLSLQADPLLDVVERRQLDLAVQELLLQATSADRAAPAAGLGRILTAEFRAGLRLLPPPEGATLPLAQLRIVEAATGIIRGITVAPCDETRVEEAAQQFARYIRGVVVAPRIGVVTVAVAPFESLGRFDRLRPLELGLRDLITNRLLEWNGAGQMDDNAAPQAANSPTFQVLQRSGMAELLRELDLIQSGLADRDALPRSLPTRASSHLIRGTIDERNDDPVRRLIVSGELVSAASGRAIYEFRFESRPETLLDALSEAVDGIVAALAPGDLKIPASARRRERIETEPLLAQTLSDLSRIHRVSPIDFANRDIFVPPELRAKQAPQTFIKPDSILGRHLLRKSVDRLESILYIQPENALAALALGYTESFHLDKVYQPQRSAEMLSKAFELDRAGRLGASALGLLPEVGFHHGGHGLDSGWEQATAERAWFALQHMPKEHRDHRWPRLLELVTPACSQTKDIATLLRILALAIPFTEQAKHEGRYSLAMSVRQMATYSALSPESSPEQRAAAVDALTHWTELDDKLLAAVAGRGLAQIAEGRKLPLEAAEWYRRAAERHAGSDAGGDRQARENLTLHAVRCYRIGKRPQEALDVLISLEPLANAASLNRGQYGLELGQCYEDLDLSEQARDAYIAAAEASPGIVDNSNIIERILRLGGVPLRDDREIDVARVAGPKGVGFLGTTMATDGRRLFLGHGVPSDRPEDQGVHVYDPGQQSWSQWIPQAGIVTALATDGQSLWIGTDARGLWCCDLLGEHARQWSANEGLPDDHVLALAWSNGPAGERTLYVSVGTSASGGLLQLSGDAPLRVFEDPLAPAIAPTHLVATEQGLLARTHLAVHEYRPQTSSWTRRAAAQPSRSSRSLAPELFSGASGVWASDYGRELFLYLAEPAHNEVFQAAWFPSGQGKSGYRLSFVHERGDDVWFGGDTWEHFQSAGLYRLNRRTGAFTRFGPRDGFAPDRGRLAAGLWLGDRLWLSTSSGLQVVTPRSNAAVP